MDVKIERPLLPLRDIVVFPNMVVPLFVGRDKSIAALNEVMKKDKKIVLVTQKNSEIDDPKKTDVFMYGCEGNILQLLKLPDGTVKVLVEGSKRVKILDFKDNEKFIICEYAHHHDVVTKDEDLIPLAMTAVRRLEKLTSINKKVSSETINNIKKLTNASHIADNIASHLTATISEKQQIFETIDVKKRLNSIIKIMENETSIIGVEKRIRGRVKTQMEKTQREYYLNEQLKAIQKELGEIEDGKDETSSLNKLIIKAKMPKDVEKKCMAELKKLKNMSPMSAEATVIRNYLDWMTDLPWYKKSQVDIDLKKALAVLDADHFGLEKVKERIIEFLAVQKRMEKIKGPILCLVGPPGVGKTSLGRSIAKALGRQYVRMSLGGVHDEAEIRGHRKTYIGAMPGKVIQNIKKAKTSNPVFVLDEIDKVNSNFRGDPSSALLEVLDPEQNHEFTDNYLEVEYDLSKVLFIATANSLDTIQPALRDRMEIIEVSGYTIEEKVEIAKRHLIPKQKKEHGLKPKDFTLDKKSIQFIVEGYTRESGVRSLERVIGSVVRSVAKSIALEEEYPKKATPEYIEKVLGGKRFDKEIYSDNKSAGVVTGLAWTAVGGEILFIESSISRGKGKLTLSGQLGDVMKESAMAAISYLKSNAEKYGIDYRVFDKYDLHVHVPAGAVPKDGPSAGITMLTALASVFTQRKVKNKTAMTGEITLRGNVLPVGGIKEKILAARRAGIKDIILSKRNQKDIEEINAQYLKGLDFHFVEKADEVLDLALLDQKVANPVKFILGE